MIEPVECFLQFAPTGDTVHATIVSLTSEMIEQILMKRWWNDPALKSPLDPWPFDRDWDWRDMEIEFDGRTLESELVGVTTTDGYVQGAMLISRDSIPCLFERNAQALFVELLFTAPRNRSILRIDGQKYMGGVGPELLRWASFFSLSRGCEGRLKLDGSPDYVAWYERLGFEILPVEPYIFEGVEYTPMELSKAKARKMRAQR